MAVRIVAGSAVAEPHAENGIAGMQRRVDSPQGVHDALDRNASERPAAQREIEALPLDIERLRVVDREAHPVTDLRTDVTLAIQDPGHRLL